MEVCVVSPHRDDAAFSCGLLLQSLLAAKVCLRLVNVCTRSSYAPYLEVPRPPTLAAVTAIRRREDDAFVAKLLLAGKADKDQIQMVDLGWLDAPDRWEMPADATLESHCLRVDELHSLRRAFRNMESAALVLAPLAIGGHIDHLLARTAAMNAIPCEKIAFYEDLPYAARVPAEPSSWHRLSGAHVAWTCRCYPRPTPGLPGSKLQYALCYSSQVNEATAKEIGDYSDALGGRERFHGFNSALDRMDELLHEQ